MRKCVNCGANLDPQEKCDCASPKGEPPCSHGAVEQGGFATDKRNMNQKCDCKKKSALCGGHHDRAQ